MMWSEHLLQQTKQKKTESKNKDAPKKHIAYEAIKITTRNLLTSDHFILTIDVLVIDLWPFRTNGHKLFGRDQTLNHYDHFSHIGHSFVASNGHNLNNTT
jgi:hypothetical protein